MKNKRNISSYAREYADPYLGHGIGPVPGYGVSFLVLIRYYYKLKLNKLFNVGYHTYLKHIF